MMAMLVVALMATVGVYAASVTGTSKTLGGTGSVTVSAPASAATAKYNTDSSGNVTSVDVTWTPGANSNYLIKVDVNSGASTGSLSVTGSGTLQRTDTVTVTSIAASSVTSVNVFISET
jgi:hypothetical protein